MIEIKLADQTKGAEIAFDFSLRWSSQPCQNGYLRTDVMRLYMALLILSDEGVSA